MNNQCKNYILIGGNGFLGKSFKKYIENKGFNVIVIGNRKLRFDGLVSKYFSLAEINLEEPEVFLNTKLSYIIIDFSYSSVPNSNIDNTENEFLTNLSNTQQYLNFAKKLNVVRYVYISSGGAIYGNDYSKIIKENDLCNPIGNYGKIKLASEYNVKAFHELYDMPTIIVRPSNIYGPEQIPFRGQGLVATIMASVIIGKEVTIFGDGNSIRDYLFIEDFNEGLFKIIICGSLGETYNLGSGIGRSVNSLLKKIEKCTYPLKINEKKYLPVRAFDIKYNVLDISKLKYECNWFPQVEIEDGINKTWKWIIKYMKLTH